MRKGEKVNEGERKLVGKEMQGCSLGWGGEKDEQRRD